MKYLFILALSIVLSGCHSDHKAVTKAVANLKPTKESVVQGKVSFEQTADGVKVVADIEGLTPGKHGFHVHEFGDCSAPDGSSAGGHYNPTKKNHGSPDVEDRHAGDLGNIVADEKGHAHYERVDKILSLNGPYSIVGKSVVVHAKEDDFRTQPAGDSGGRLSCGVIVAQ